MSDKPPLHIPARDIPVPRSVSPVAQASLEASAARPHTPYPEPDDIQGWLRYVEEAKSATPPWVDPRVEQSATAQDIDFGGVPGFLVEPRHGNVSDRILYNIHGGGLVGGGGRTCRMTSMQAAVSIHAKTYSIDYRMPPLHPFPVPLEDCMVGYKFLLERYPSERIVVRGSSAGGNLAAALMLRCRAQGIPFPAAVILWTPELDLTESGDSFAVLAGVDVVQKTSLMNINLLYANGHDLSNPDLSPLFGDFAPGFPPTLLTAGTRDLFLSNAVRMHNALRRSGNHSELLIEEAMPHGGFFGAPEDEALAADLRDFADRAWAGKLER